MNFKECLNIPSRPKSKACSLRGSQIDGKSAKVPSFIREKEKAKSQKQS